MIMQFSGEGMEGEALQASRAAFTHQRVSIQMPCCSLLIIMLDFTP